MSTVVTGIQPSGTPHLGNYFGMIAPALALAERHTALYFIASYHALTGVRDPAMLERRTLDVAAAWIALGLDPQRTVLYVQSDVPEVCELAWLLSCVTGKGVLNRAHAYKAMVDSNAVAGRPADDGINVGVFNYPLLMAADILIHRADLVPVGRDQRQHIEMTRDIAQAFNAVYGDVLAVPDGVTDPAVATIPGTDGRKMSKSYDNVVPILADRDEVTRRVMAIRTDSRRPDEPKDPATCNVFALYRHLARSDEVDSLAAAYRQGGVGYRQAKDLVVDAHQRRFAEPTARFVELRADERRLRTLLAAGADAARGSARPTVHAARLAAGLC